MKTLVFGLAVMAGALAAVTPVLAQGDQYMELLRQDLHTDKVAIMTASMGLTTEQGDAFWPIYREYQTELSEIGDKRIAMIKSYAENYETMTGDKAGDLMKDWFNQQKDRLKLLEKTAKKVAKATDPVIAVRFVQVENVLNRIIDLQETLDILKMADEAGLVLQPSNTQNVVNICCCCGCCCGVLRTIKRYPKPATLVSAPFVASYNPDTCEGCGVCEDRCQMEAISMEEGKVLLDIDRCIGCGLCVSTCPTDSLTLMRKIESKQPKVPKNIIEASIKLGRERIPKTLSLDDLTPAN